MKVAVLGSGSWGTALAILLTRNGHEVTLVGRSTDEIADLQSTRVNHRYLPGFEVPQPTRFTLLNEDLGATDMTVVAVPSHAVREVVSVVKGEHPLVVVAAKGLEANTAKRMSEVVAEALPTSERAVLSGPNLAVEIVREIPTAAVSASINKEIADQVRAAFMCKTFRVYLSSDVVGVELAGSLKNVLAIGAGMSDGLGFGDNTKGALLARGLHEMTSLGIAMGACTDTFMGLAGVGDLFATAASQLSRNYRVGRSLGEGVPLDQAVTKVDQVVEGVTTSACAQILAKVQGIEMPMFAAIDAVITGRLSPRDAVQKLMERTPKAES
ncbi:MAG: glycerol-3-phosphate dehydrogenase [Fimbriimonadaceae bacterium]|jgi:glycerol-3-phosphate dehydrogenase (NAD(P)+)|nr:glycerol-3-phosphate dehydrogenase [Fimbriimonadaceae bacterium]